jgi:thiol-disulfide isomerase/thioredoxin
MWRHLPLYTVLLLVTSLNLAFAEKAPVLLMFTASWCASCRDVLPAVKAYAANKNYAVQIVDVDNAAADALTRQYGLTLKQVSPPMVYFVGAAGKTLVLDEGSDTSKTQTLLQQNVK